MSLNLSALAARVVSAGINLSQASSIVTAAIGLIETVETVYEGLKGSEKLAAVEAGLETVIQDLGLQAEVTKILSVVKPIVSLVVTIYNLRSLWPKPPAITLPMGVGGASSGLSSQGSGASGG